MKSWLLVQLQENFSSWYRNSAVPCRCSTIIKNFPSQLSLKLVLMFSSLDHSCLVAVFFFLALPIVLPESLSSHGILSSFLVKSAEVKIKCHLSCLHTSCFSSKHFMTGPKWLLPEIRADSLNEITRGHWQEGVWAWTETSLPYTPGTQPCTAS